MRSQTKVTLNKYNGTIINIIIINDLNGNIID